MDQAAIGTNQKVLVICVRYTDAATTRLATGGAWAALLNTQINTFFNQATFNATNFTFEVPGGGPANRWFDLGYASANYNYYRTGQDAVSLADPHVNFANYNRVVVITNWPGFGGQGAPRQIWTVSEGVEFVDTSSGSPVGRRVMSLSICNEWVARDSGENGDAGAAVIAHELGHHLDLPTHYSDVRWSPGTTRDTISPWDLMGYSPFQRHFLGWAKAQRGWLAAGRVRTVGPPTTSTVEQVVRLKPLETAASTGTQLVKVPFSPSGHFEGYALENRQQINGDEQLPQAGVVVSLVDESPEIAYGFRDIVMENSTAPGNLDRASLAVGQSYRDEEYDINITVEGQVGNEYDVRVRYPLTTNRPDPAITPWGAPPWETPDIWIDSSRNGWGTYRYTNSAGRPIGNGDDPWINHDNRVYVRIRNLGTRTATNVRVQVFVNQPPGMGDAGPNWAFIGAIVFSSVPPGGTPVEDFVLWKPEVAAHTCIRAVIDDSPGELSASNNRAQENVAVFETASSSPWQPITLATRVYSPFQNEPTSVRMNVRDVPAGWAIAFDPPSFDLEPGGAADVHFTAYPSGAPGYKDPRSKRYRVGYIGKPKIEALVPYADTFIPIGGVDVWVHLVRPTKIDARASRKGEVVLVRGSITPPIAKAPIAVDLFDRRRSSIYHGRTNAKGAFTIRIPKKASGKATVEVSFAGDKLHGSSASETVKIG